MYEIKSTNGATLCVALWLLGSTVAGGIESFNDHPDTTWEDVQAVFGVAIKTARRFSKKS